MKPPRRLDLLRYALRHHDGTSAGQEACLDPRRIALTVDGMLDADEHEAVVSHLAACGACRASVASVARMLDDRAVAREVAALERRRSGRAARIVVSIAVAATLTLVITTNVSRDETAVHRAPTITALPAPVPSSPVGPVASAAALSWTGVPDADRYRVTLFNAEGDVLYEAEGTETMVTLPDSVSITAGRSYLWRVDARVGFDRWAGSELVEFTVHEAGPR